MPKIQISKELINSIANQNNKKFVNNVNQRVNETLSLAIDSLSSKVSYINKKNVVLQPLNELLNNSFVDNSSCVYFLGVDSAQLEINTAKKSNFWANFKEKLKFAWQNRKAFTKRKSKKRRKKLKVEDNSEKKIKKFDASKYSIFDLTEDLQISLSNFLSETSMITLFDNSLRIIGKEDFGSNIEIIIYVVNLSENTFKYYAGRKKGFLTFDLSNRIKQLDDKINIVGENFTKMLKIFNALFYNVNGFMPNQIFIESILISCPNELFSDNEIYNVYKKILNYISLTSIRLIKSINDPTKTINEDVLCGNCGIGFNKMINYIF